MKWYSPSQVSTGKHVSYPQLTATAWDHIAVGYYVSESLVNHKVFYLTSVGQEKDDIPLDE